MSLAIAGKVVGGLILGSASAVGIGYIIYDALQDKRLAFFVESTALTGSDNATAIFDTDGKIKNKIDGTLDYKCKFADKTEFDCTITSFGFDTKTKHSHISQFTAGDENSLKKDKLQAKGNLYKVIVNNSDDESQVDDAKSEFEIISKANDDSNKKFAKFKILLAMNGTTVNYKYTKRQYFVVKGTEETAISVDGTTTKCSFDATKFEDTCSIYTFGSTTDNSTDLKKWTFNKGTTATNSIVKDKYYLIELTKEINDTTQYEKMFIKKGVEEKKTLTNVMTAIKFEGTSDNEHLFILN